MLSNIIEIIILSLVQGISEFIPISSSAHLIIVSKLYEFKSSSLLIIIFFFKRELINLQNNKKLLKLIIFGSIPLITVGYIIYATEFIYLLRNIEIIAWTTLIFGIILYLADRNRLDKKITSDLNLKTILYIGLFQILALIPGVSRAGITITAARIFKFNRVDSVKISFLLSIPALAGASILGLKDIFEKSIQFNYLVLIAISLAFILSLITIKFFLSFINKFSLNIFVFYRIIIAVILFIIIYS